jgi:heat shock protein HtpX
MGKNSVKTAVLLAGMGGLFVLLGSAFGGRSGASIGLIFGLVMVGGSYWFSDKLAIRSARAQEVTAEEFPEYHRSVAALAEKANIPMPRLYVSPNPQPNAFATGRNPSHAAVCVTQGLIEQLQWNEVEGVLAHELSHVKHRDILIGSVAAAIAMGITFAARMAMYAGMFGGGGRDDDRPNPIALLAMSILAPVAAGVMQMAVSRSREYEADAGAARLLGSETALVSALGKISRGVAAQPVAVNPAQASAYIANPFGGRKVQFSQLYSTHPPMEDRIARLQSGDWR